MNTPAPRELGSGLAAVVRAVMGEEPAGSTAGRVRQLQARALDSSEIWLLLAVVGRRLPSSEEVDLARRVARHRGVGVVLRRLRRERLRPDRWFEPRVSVVAGALLVDAEGTVASRLGTGVQRVGRAVLHDWLDRGLATPIGWDSTRRRLVRLDVRSVAAGRPPRRGGAIVPWGGWYLLPDPVTEGDRSTRIQAIASFSGAYCVLIGHDAIPLTTAETTGPSMAGAFAKYLAAASRFQLVVCTSENSRLEYEGWRKMLASAGLPGPEIEVVRLPQHADLPAVQPADVRDSFGDDPLVLCVGSHEPRKNHTAVLQAAQVLWARGERFTLGFVGGNSWSSERFDSEVLRLQDRGLPVRVLVAPSDAVLLGAYRAARLTVFPSLNEGFGLPIAESLAAGTPVVTSNFGSMAEIAGGRGALLVDPRDEDALADAIGALLVDGPVREHVLAELGAGRDDRGWEDYARQLAAAVLAYNGSTVSVADPDSTDPDTTS